MAKIVSAPIRSIKPNPARLLKHYPFNEKKIESLMRSMSVGDVGCWEGVIARKAGDKYELAFGHHRLEAAKRLKYREIPLILKPLSDEQMVQYMGRENGEDYATDFEILLETWEAAANVARGRAQTHLDIAKIVGWIRKNRNDIRANELAQACANAHDLIEAGHLNREDLSGISVSSARDIVQRAAALMREVDKIAKKKNISEADVKKSKTKVAKAAKKTAKEVKEGKVAARDIKSEVDSNTYQFSKEKDLPLFSKFGTSLANGIEKMLNTDKTSEKLNEVAKSLNKITENKDIEIVQRIQFELDQLELRVQGWQKKMILKKTAKVINKAKQGVLK